jgi:ABC-type glycerol-3-phosphate transport system substrate-binding protein
MRRLAAALVVLAAVAVLAAGCGGSSRNTAYASSKAAYGSAVDSICANAVEKAKDLDLSTTAMIAKNGSQAGDILDTLAQNVEKLEPPAALKHSAQSFTDGLQQEADKLGDLQDAAKKGDTAKIKQLQGDLTSESAATSEDARFLGATGCARLFS